MYFTTKVSFEYFEVALRIGTANEARVVCNAPFTAREAHEVATRVQTVISIVLKTDCTLLSQLREVFLEFA